MNIVIKREHNKNCFLQESKKSPWVVDRRNPTSYGDIRGGNRGQTTSWINMRCNDPQCPALILVNEWELSDQAHYALSDKR